MSLNGPHPIQVGQHLGPYCIQGFLGSGGMGRVYLALDTLLERTVAIKVVDRTRQDPRALVREARLTAALNHPAICTVYEIGHDGDRPFIVMEHVRGVPLFALIQGEHAVPFETALSYELQVADAVAHAHDRNIIHGDIKSSNVMIMPDGRAKVLDFGLAVRRNRSYAAVAADADTQTASPSIGCVGTVPYMAPELLRGESPDVQSDIWALGVVLHEMLTGYRPFRGATVYTLAANILADERVAVSGQVPRGVFPVLERCLHPRPEDRYPSVREFGAALDDLAAVWPMENPPSWPSNHLGPSLSAGQ